ncbi:Gfo/Idh/MocA family oxidoreductase, partial [Aeromonas media]
VAVNDIKEWNFAEPKDYDAEISAANYQTTSVYGFGHPPYFQNVADVLRGTAEPETDGREGLKSLELLISIYRSARDHKEIGLPLNI